MRITYVVGAFPSTRETFVANEIIDLLRRGVEVEVFSWFPPADEVIHPEVTESGILEHTHYFRYRYLPQVLLSGTFWRSLYPVLLGRYRRRYRTLRDKMTAAYFAARVRALGHRHIHSHFIGRLAEGVSDLSRTTFSYTAHCYTPLEQMSPVARALLPSRTQASLVVAASEYVSRGRRSEAPEEVRDRVKVVRCGIDVTRFQPDADSPKTIDVLCVAGLGPTKGLEYLIRAAKILSETNPEVRVVHLGSGSPAQQALYQQECETLGTGDCFRLAGAVSSDQVKQHLAQSRVFALPCIITEDGYMDGLPVALMEAAAMELPMVSTEVAGIPELVIDGVTGLVVPQRDPEALAAAIQRLLDDEDLRQRLGKAARKRVEEEFSRELNGERLLTYLKPFLG